MADSPTTTDPIVTALARGLKVDEQVAAWVCHHVRNAVMPLVVLPTPENLEWYCQMVPRIRERMLRLALVMDHLCTPGGVERLREILKKEQEVGQCV